MTVFPFRPAYLSATVGWLTEVAQTYDSERRTELRSIPRLDCKSSFVLIGTKMRTAQSLIEGSANELLFPDWRYAQSIEAGFSSASLTVTVDTSFFYLSVGDAVVVWQDDATFTETTISAIAGSSVTLASGPVVAYTQSILMKLHEGVISSPFGSSIQKGAYLKSSFSFVVTDYTDLQSYFAGDEFDGDYVAARNVVIGAHMFSLDLGYSNVDFEIGPIAPVRVRSVDAFTDMVQFNPEFGQELLETEAIFHKLKGRLNSFWKPTWLVDFTLHTAATIGQFYLRVDEVPVGTSIPAVAIDLSDGTQQYYEVTSWATSGSYSQLELSTSITASFIVDDVVSISLMRRARLDTDEAVFRFDAVGDASVKATTLGVSA